MKHQGNFILTTTLLLASFVLGGCSGSNLDYVAPHDDNYRNYYEIFVSSYADSDGDGIGDLKGITAKLEYLNYMAYSGIWLTPIHESPSYHKYNVTDYYSVDPDFGTLDDLKTLVSEAHKLNINVILDLVMNHCSRSNQIFKDAVVAYDKKIKDQAMSESEIGLANAFIFYENEAAKNLANPPRANKLVGYPYYYRCDFDVDMPDFNLLEPYVIDYFKNIVTYYLEEIDVDGFRLDAVKHFELGNTVKNAEIISQISDHAKDVKDDAYIVCEVWDNGYTISQYYDYSSADSYFYFPAANGDSKLLTRSLARDGMNVSDYTRLIGDVYSNANGHIPAPFIDNHDVPRIMYQDLSKTKMLYGLLGMLNGTTFTYYGDEIGMSHVAVSGSEDYADVAYRAHMPWGEKEDQGNCNDPKPSGVSRPGEYPFGDVKSNRKDQKSIINYYRRVNIFRNKYLAIARGEPSITIAPEADKASTLIRKDYNNKATYIALNLSPFNSETLDLDNLQIEIKDSILTGTKKPSLKDGTLKLPPYSIVILE